MSDDQNESEAEEREPSRAARAIKEFRGDAWDRQSGEPSRAFEAFARFRDMGAKRSIKKLCESDPDNRALGQFHTWSARWLWVRRAEAFDIEMDRLHVAEMREARREAARRHVRQAQYLQQVALKALRTKYGDNLENLDPSSFENRDLLRFMVEATKMERVAVGEPESIVEQQVTGGVSGSVPESERRPVVPLTFAGRLEEALALLEAARARAAGDAAGESD